MKTSLLITLLTICQLLCGQVTNSVFPGLPYSDLQNIAVEGSNIFTSGDCGIALVSQNDGVDWTTIEFDERGRELKVTPGSNGQKALYMTSNQIFEFDIDSKSFTPKAESLLPQSGTLADIEVSDSKIYVLATAGVFVSSAPNYEWTRLAEINYTMQDDFGLTASLTSNYFYIGSKNGEVVKVSLADGAVTYHSSFVNRIYELQMATDDIGYAYVAAQNTFSKTIDGGQTWTMLTGMSEGINPRIFGPDIIMSINTNRMYVSRDGGASSTYIPMPEDGFTDLVSDAYVTSDGQLYLSGRSSMILKSTDFGNTFENKNKYKRADLQSINFNDSGLGYAVGYSGSVVKTTDGGSNWATTEVGLTVNEHLTSVVTYEDGRMVVGHDQGVAIIDNDQLTEYQTETIDFIIKSHTGDYLIGVMSAQNEGKIVKSSDRGNSWTTKAFVPRSYVKPYQSPTGKLYVPSGENSVYTSTDHGENWIVEDFGLPSVSDFSFLNDAQGLFVSEGDLYKTENGAETASLIASDFAIGNIYYFNEDQILFTNAQGGETRVRVSDNGGASFATVANFCSTTNASYYDGDKTIWLAQKGGHINKYVYNGLMLSNTETISEEKLVLSPNPVRIGEQLLLGHELKGTAQVQLYNLEGSQQWVVTATGSTMIIPELPSGYYFISITENGLRRVGKLVITE